MRRAIVVVLALVCALHAQAAEPWSQLEFLIGNWTGVAGPKDTALGPGQGSFSFEPQLDRKIVVRRNTANYDSGQSHDDLMIIYLDGTAPKAIYFDSEGHVIRYDVAFPSDNKAVFESKEYRLTYWLDGTALKGKFKIAASPGAYKTYLQWSSIKR